jgi:hypothetical protein
MDGRGLFLDFVVCKVGVALAAIALISAVLVMSSSSGRTIERGEMTAVADTITQAIRAADGMPGEIQITSELPSVGFQFCVEIVGTYDNMQVVRVIIDGQSYVERVFLLREKINGGTFELSRDNPTLIRLAKVDEISLELI